MHCINVMTGALGPGKDKGASILIGGKGHLKIGATMGTVIIPFMKLESDEDFEKLQDLAQRKPDFPNTYLALGQLYARNAATLPQARAAYQQFLKVAPNDPNAAAVRQWLQRQ